MFRRPVACAAGRRGVRVEGCNMLTTRGLLVILQMEVRTTAGFSPRGRFIPGLFLQRELNAAVVPVYLEHARRKRQIMDIGIQYVNRFDIW